MTDCDAIVVGGGHNGLIAGSVIALNSRNAAMAVLEGSARGLCEALAFAP